MPDDHEIFRAAMADARRLTDRKGRKSVKVVEPPPRLRDLLRERPIQPREPEPPKMPAGARPLDPVAATGLDRASDTRLRRGRVAPDAKLDLHGYTLAEAERALTRFLATCQQRDQRLALVVTGKGLREADGRMVGGRIRAEFPHWLNRPENRARVVGVRAASPRHGGGGAFYVVLRKAG